MEERLIKEVHEEQQVYYIINEEINKQRINTSIEKNIEQQGISIKIVNVENQSFFKIQTQYYQIEVISKKGQKWMIKRKYNQCQWLYHTLIVNFPGIILPYFPNQSIQTYFNQIIQYRDPNKTQLIKNIKQLTNFLQQLCDHPILSSSQQVKIFLLPNDFQFRKQKKVIQQMVSQSQSVESTSNGLMSIFQRSVAWITNNPVEEITINQKEGWKQTQKNIKKWILDLSRGLQNFSNLIKLKEQEIEWNGPQTQIDIVEKLKAKVLSGKQYNRILIDEIQSQVLQILQSKLKSTKQIQSQLAKHQQIVKLILYLKKYQSQEIRCEKLIRKKALFQINLINSWKQYSLHLRNTLEIVHIKFKTIWENYSKKMIKIWK